MNIIKELREKSGYTQTDLAEKSGLSLRTIQRLETSSKPPKGHSLTVLSKTFNVEPSVFQEGFLSVEQHRESDVLSIKLINLSILAFFGIPFGNIIVPFILWRKKRGSKPVDQAGRKIINTQIIWSVILAFLLCLSPFIDNRSSDSFPLILVVLFTAISINLVLVGFTAFLIQRDQIDLLKPPLSFL